MSVHIPTFKVLVYESRGLGVLVEKGEQGAEYRHILRSNLEISRYVSHKSYVPHIGSVLNV